MSDAWIKANARHPDNCSEYDVLFADDVAKVLGSKDAKIESLQNSIISACERVMQETGRKPLNCRDMALLFIELDRELAQHKTDSTSKPRMDLANQIDQSRKVKRLEAELSRTLNRLQKATEQLAAREWMPIESAPKDGTEVMLYDKIYGARTGSWMVGINFTGWNYSQKPTRWQPLPPEPKGET